MFEELTASWLGDAGRLKVYSKSYPDSARLKGFIADVYLGVAELAIESIEYYARPPYGSYYLRRQTGNLTNVQSVSGKRFDIHQSLELMSKPMRS